MLLVHILEHVWNQRVDVGSYWRVALWQVALKDKIIWTNHDYVAKIMALQ